MNDSKNQEVQDDMEAAEELREEETETAGLLTGMKLDDSAEEFRNTDPDFDWSYFIEIYPWHADDMTDKFVKLIRLADFTRVVMRRKKNGKETTDVVSEEKVKDHQPHRQRMGCLQFYLQNRMSAKAVMRSLTWKSMAAKELTIELTRRDPADKANICETAYLELNTYPLCKCRFREKATGELKDRSTRVSKIPGEITRGFLEVVLTRAYPVVGAAADKSFAAHPLQKLEDIEDFKGVLDFDCMSRGSARAFVQAHKRIVLNGQDLTVVAVDEQTMVTPTQPIPDPNKAKKKEVKTSLFASQDDFHAKGTRGRGAWGSYRGARGGVVRGGGVRGGSVRGGVARGAISRGAISRGGHEEFSGHQGYVRDSPRRDVPARGNGRPIQPLMRPFSAPVPRNGPGMPLVPMTGRQKMNEKLRTGMRGAGPGSVGDSFKAEIAHLQNQLTESTMALQERIALLQGREGFYDSDMAAGYDDMAAGYSERAGGYDSWSRGYAARDYGYDRGYAGDNTYAQPTSRRGTSPRGSGSRGGGGARGIQRERW